MAFLAFKKVRDVLLDDARDFQRVSHSHPADVVDDDAILDPMILEAVMSGDLKYVEKMNLDAVKMFGIEKVREAIAKHAGEV